LRGAGQSRQAAPTSQHRKVTHPKPCQHAHQDRPAEIDRAAGERGAAEDDFGAGERGDVEVTRAAGELGADEVDRAGGKLGVSEVDLAAGEPGAGEVAAVEDHTGEVEVEAAPGLRGGSVQVGGDDPDDGVADVAAGLEGQPLLQRGILAGVWFVGHAQIAAEHIDAGLPILLPIISQARHRIDPGELDGRLVAAEFVGRRSEPLV